MSTRYDADRLSVLQRRRLFVESSRDRSFMHERKSKRFLVEIIVRAVERTRCARYHKNPSLDLFFFLFLRTNYRAFLQDSAVAKVFHYYKIEEKCAVPSR